MTGEGQHLRGAKLKNMSHYSQLPIYHDIFFLLKELYARVPNFSKQYKYFLGGKIVGLNVEMIECLYQISQTYNQNERQNLIKILEKNTEMLSLHIRIAQELKLWGGEKKYLFLAEKISNIKLQIENWKKYLKKSNSSLN